MDIIFGKCQLLNDKTGQPYLAVDIKEDQYSSFAQFMLYNNFHQDVERKLSRDKGHYHVTLISAAQWGSLIKKELADQVLKEIHEKELSFICHGIGKAEKDGHNAHFVILENSEINQFRAKYDLSPHDFHMTLAFNEKDVHGVPKNKSTCVYTISDIKQSNSINKLKEIRPLNKFNL